MEETPTKRKIGYFYALFHLIKFAFAPTILTVPWIFQYFPMWYNVVIVLLLMAFVLLGLHKMLRYRYKAFYTTFTCATMQDVALGNKPSPKYPFRGQKLVDFDMVLYYTGICTAHILSIAEVIQNITSYYCEKSFDTNIILLFILGGIIALSLIPIFRFCFPFQIVAFIILLLGFSLLMRAFVTDTSHSAFSDPINDFTFMPHLIGCILYATCPIGIIFNLESDLRNTKILFKKLGVLNISMFIIIVVVLAFGLMGEWRYAGIAQDIVVLNVPEEKGFGHFVKVLYAFANVLLYPMDFGVLINITWQDYIRKKMPPNYKHGPLFEKLYRILYALLLVFLAYLLGNVARTISFFGCVTVPVMIWMLPALIDISTPDSDVFQDLVFVFLTVLVSMFCAGLIIIWY